MLANNKIHVIVTCERPGWLPRELLLYYAPGETALTVKSANPIRLDEHRTMYVDAEVRRVEFGRSSEVDSVREIHGHVLGVRPDGNNNAAEIHRIEFYAEDATFVMQLRPDGSLEETSWHCLDPHWDFPGYVDEKGDRFRQPMYPGSEWTKTGDTWGFTRYSIEETH